jgi:hypothetical protein
VSHHTVIKSPNSHSKIQKHSTSAKHGKKKEPKKSYPPNDQHSIEHLVGNGNEYPVPDLNRTMVNITSEVSDVYKKILQKGNYGRDH